MPHCIANAALPALEAIAWPSPKYLKRLKFFLQLARRIQNLKSPSLMGFSGFPPRELKPIKKT
jgi:hypothetical protein